VPQHNIPIFWNVTPRGLVDTNIPEKHGASIFNSDLKMKPISSYETPYFYIRLLCGTITHKFNIKDFLVDAAKALIFMSKRNVQK
jgi:hypothetical protein